MADLGAVQRCWRAAAGAAVSDRRPRGQLLQVLQQLARQLQRSRCLVLGCTVSRQAACEPVLSSFRESSEESQLKLAARAQQDYLHGARRRGTKMRNRMLTVHVEQLSAGCRKSCKLRIQGRQAM